MASSWILSLVSCCTDKDLSQCYSETETLTRELHPSRPRRHPAPFASLMWSHWSSVPSPVDLLNLPLISYRFLAQFAFDRQRLLSFHSPLFPCPFLNHQFNRPLCLFYCLLHPYQPCYCFDLLNSIEGCHLASLAPTCLVSSSPPSSASIDARRQRQHLHFGLERCARLVRRRLGLQLPRLD